MRRSGTIPSQTRLSICSKSMTAMTMIMKPTRSCLESLWNAKLSGNKRQLMARLHLHTLRTGKKSDEGLGGRGEDGGGIPKEEKKDSRETSSDSVLHESKSRP